MSRPTELGKYLLFLLATIARSMADRHSRELSGTVSAVLRALTHDKQAASMLSTWICLVFSGLSHLQDTSIVGSAVSIRASRKYQLWSVTGVEQGLLTQRLGQFSDAISVHHIVE